MDALVLYESSFGNTAAIARAVADGLGELMAVRLAEVGEPLPAGEPPGLVVVGGPTHAFGMSRPQTRRDALQQAHRDGDPGPGVREWITAHPPDARSLYATFDTRATKVRHLPGSAARGAERALRRAGARTVAEPESFYVTDVQGPLVAGEEQRARDWGRQLARSARQTMTDVR
ncbi:flavodoxin family protein [Puerhibacterium sp. TATVAM-FAB25]|uniref:flavodoxin family protein n=1 Tax=Puerhibacterium sp. TATVAM-FAB25 TaxID=3093699 RepID=UPI00397B0CC0